MSRESDHREDPDWTGEPPKENGAADSSEQLVDRATEVVREAIVTGRLAPGSRLVQEQLASEIGISRTPLREALRRLEQEGLVAMLGTRGLAVTELTPEGLLDSYEIREVLDGLATRLAASRMSPGELAELYDVHRRSHGYIELWNPQEWLRSNAEFHRLILRGAHSPALRRAMPPARMSGQLLFPGVFLHPGHAQDAYEDHEAILAALRERDEEASQRLAEAHVARQRRALIDQIGRASPPGPKVRRIRSLKPLDAELHEETESP